MPTLLRDLLRQRSRSALTLIGVALGLLTLVILGGLGEHFRATVAEAQASTQGLLRIYTKTNAQGINPGVTEADLDRVRALPEVAVVAPTLMLMLDGFNLEEMMFLETQSSLPRGSPATKKSSHPI